MYYKVIQYCAYAALALPAVPPIFLPLFQPYTFAKTELFELLVEAMALLYLSAFSLEKIRSAQQEIRNTFQAFGLLRMLSFGFRVSRVETALLLFTATVIMSTALSADPARSFWGSSARMDGLFTLLHFAAFFFILVSTLGETAWDKLMRWSVLVSAYVALYGIAQWFEMPFVRASEGAIFSTLGNPAYLATYALFHVFLSLVCARQARSREARAVFGISAAVHTLVILLASVAAVFVGLIAGAVVAARPYFRARIRPAQGLVVVSLATLGIILFLTSSPLHTLAPTASGHLLSLESRLRAWRIASDAALERPLFGHGPNQFENTFLAYKARGYPVPATGETFDKPHNAYLETLFNFGIVGFAAHLYLLWVALSRSRGLIRGALVGYLVSLFFFFDTFSSLLIFFFLLAYLSRRENASVSPTSISPHTVIAVILGALAFFFLFHFKPLYSAYWAHRGVKNKALLYDSFNRPFIERAFLLERTKLEQNP